MNKENTGKLIDAFPSLYPNRLFVGCGDGWYQLLIELSTEILSMSARFGIDPPTINSISEKHGGLRIDIATTNHEIINLVNDYENKSESICDVCGAKGQIRDDRFVMKTRCDEHK